MKIHENMDLDALAERMGTEATRSDAESMRDLLVDSGFGATGDVPDEVWMALLDTAVPLVKAAGDAANQRWVAERVSDLGEAIRDLNLEGTEYAQAIRDTLSELMKQSCPRLSPLNAVALMSGLAYTVAAGFGLTLRDVENGCEILMDALRERAEGEEP